MKTMKGKSMGKSEDIRKQYQHFKKYGEELEPNPLLRDIERREENKKPPMPEGALAKVMKERENK